VLAYGVTGMTALDAADTLADSMTVEVWDARFAKPVDIDLVERLITAGIPIVTVEDHGLIGGFGAAVIEAAADRGLDTSHISRLGLPDHWIHQGSRGEQLAQAGIDVTGIISAIRAAAIPRDMPVAITGTPIAQPV
jgi:1-deoxy-D-xylulose-5-phosphate synthase